MIKRSIVTILNLVLMCNLIVGSYPALGKKSEASTDVIVPPVAGVDVQSLPAVVNGEVLSPAYPPVKGKSYRND
jgi:hypothetical protein